MEELCCRLSEARGLLDIDFRVLLDGLCLDKLLPGFSKERVWEKERVTSTQRRNHPCTSAGFWLGEACVATMLNHGQSVCVYFDFLFESYQSLFLRSVSFLCAVRQITLCFEGVKAAFRLYKNNIHASLT